MYNDSFAQVYALLGNISDVRDMGRKPLLCLFCMKLIKLRIF